MLYEFLYFHSSLSQSTCSISQSVILCQLSLSLSVSLGRYFQLCEWCGRSGSTWGVIRRLLRAVPWGSHPRGEVRELENYRTDDVTGVWIWRMCFICPQRRMLSTQGAKKVTDTHICCQNKNSTYGTILNFHNIYWAVCVYYLQLYNY